MAQTAEELKTALKDALKRLPAKPYFFAIVVKGGAEGALIVDKRKIPAKLVDAAKKEFNASTVVRGLCFGDNGTLVLETAKPQPNTIAAIAKRFAQLHAGLTIKPECRAGRGEEDVAEDEAPAAPASGSAASSQGSAAPAHGQALAHGAAPAHGQAPSAAAAPSAARAASAAPSASGAPAASAAPVDAAHKAYDGLLARLKPQIAAARDAKSPLLPKLASVLEFAAGKAAAGDHRTAVQALQSAQALLEPASSSSTSSSSSSSSSAPASTVPPAAAAPAASAAPSASASSAAPPKRATTTRERAPVEPEAARDFLGKVDAAEPRDAVTAATAGLLDDLKAKLKTSKRLVTVPDIDALAAAMARENGMTVQAARELIDNNKGRGFTGESGTVYVLGNTPQAAHDEVHETVHLLSAPGGATKIMAKYGEQFNEGLTEFFTKEMCRKLNVPDAVAYPEHVAFIGKLERVVGYDMLYTAYMKNGGFDPVIDKLTDLWIAKAATLPQAQKPMAVKGVVNREQSRAAIDRRFADFPPQGSASKFWDTVFFA